MIAFINGILIHKSTDSVIVDVGGVGYEVFIPMSTFMSLPDLGEKVALKVHTHHKEDAINLYGFLTAGEKELFCMLIGVSGVGPKLARNILSGISVVDLASAIGSSDKARLSKIPGVGAKSAERLILELKDKVVNLTAVSGAPQSAGAEEKDPVIIDATSALENLGYKTPLAAEAVKKAKADLGDGFGFEELFKESLKLLSKR